MIRTDLACNSLRFSSNKLQAGVTSDETSDNGVTKVGIAVVRKQLCDVRVLLKPATLSSISFYPLDRAMFQDPQVSIVETHSDGVISHLVRSPFENGSPRVLSPGFFGFQSDNSSRYRQGTARERRSGHEWSIDEANEQYAPACFSNATSLSFPVLFLPPRLSDSAYWAHHLTACYLLLGIPKKREACLRKRKKNGLPRRRLESGPLISFVLWERSKIRQRGRLAPSLADIGCRSQLYIYRACSV